MASLTLQSSITQRIHLLENLRDSLNTHNPGQIATSFDRVMPEDRAVLEALAPLNSRDTRHRHTKEVGAVQELLTLLRNQSVVSAATSTVSSLADRSTCLSPAPSGPKRHRTKDAEPSTPALSSLPLAPPTVRSTLPSFFLQRSLFLLHPQDTRALSCVSRRIAQDLRVYNALQPLNFHVQQAIRLDDADSLQNLLTPLPTTPPLDTAILLVQCIRDGSFKCLEVLVNMGMDLTQTSPGGLNILHFCARFNRATMLRYLLDKTSASASSSDKRKHLIEGRSREGETPLLSCAQSGSIECLQVLLKHGANVLAADKREHNIVHVSILQGHSAFAREVLTFLDPSFSTKLVTQGNAEGNTPLFCIALNNSLPPEDQQQMLDVLFTCGNNPIHLNKKLQNFTHICAENGCDALLERYLKKMTPTVNQQVVKAKDLEGNTALMYAAICNSIRCANILIPAGSDLLTVNYSNNTLFSYCYKPSRRSLQTLLFRHQPKLEGFLTLNLFMHVFGVERNFKLGGTSGTKFAFIGAEDLFMRQEFSKLLHLDTVKAKMVPAITEEHYTELLASFDSCLVNREDFNATTLRKIQDGHLVVMAAGWEEHAVCLVWYRGYYIVCNRGELSSDQGLSRTFFSRKVDLSRLTLDLLVEIYTHSDSSKRRTGAHFLYITLPHRLSATEDSVCTSLSKIAPKASKAGVCTYASKKAGFRAALALLTQNVMLAKAISKRVATVHRQHALNYFKVTPSPLADSAKRKLTALGNQTLRKRESHLYEAALS